MGQAIAAWGSVNELALQKLFDGSDPSLVTLGSLISDGKMIEGAVNGNYEFPPAPGSGPSPQTLTDLEAGLTKAFFGYAIPAIWSVSGTYPFIIDSGYDCGITDPLSEYLSPDTMHATYGCVNNKLYYLASPTGPATDCDDSGNCSPNQFSAPPGINWLDGTSFGGVTVLDLITG
jgi:hypothetical protein